MQIWRSNHSQLFLCNKILCFNAYYEKLFRQSVILIECLVTLKWFLLYTWHILLLFIRGEGSSSVALLKVSSLFSPVQVFFLFLRSFSWSDVRSWHRDVVCGQIVKPSEANVSFVILGYSIQNKLNWIEYLLHQHDLANFHHSFLLLSLIAYLFLK